VKTLAINQANSGADLVSRIRAGDRQAEAELVERYHRGVRIIIRREVGAAGRLENRRNSPVSLAAWPGIWSSGTSGVQRGARF